MEQDKAKDPNQVYTTDGGRDGPGDARPLPGAGGATPPGGQAGSDGSVWRYVVPEQQAGTGAEQSNSAHYTGGASAGDSRESGFLPSPPEANAMPSGAAQTSRGSAGLPQTGGGGTRADAGAMGGDTGAGGAGGQGGTGGNAGGGGGKLDAAGAGAGKTPGTPGGNGNPDNPIWGS